MHKHAFNRTLQKINQILKLWGKDELTNHIMLRQTFPLLYKFGLNLEVLDSSTLNSKAEYMHKHSFNRTLQKMNQI